MPQLSQVLKLQASKLNLLSKADQEKIESKHLPDSLEVLKFWKAEKGSRVLDLGTGGGLPGLPLAEACPEMEFTLLDATQKKCGAIVGMMQEMGFKNVRVVTGRFEDKAHEKAFRETFDLVVARAVAPLPTLLEYVAGFLKVGGHFYAWKGPDYLEELRSASDALNLLSFSMKRAHAYTLPGEEKRFILEFVKTEATKFKYPRKDGMPKKHPL